MAENRTMNRWSVAALAVVGSVVAFLVLFPPHDCDDAMINECGGLQINPLLVVVAGVILTLLFGLAAVLRSSK
jgi:hypothetical protein